MPRKPIKEWTPPKDKEVYTEILCPNTRVLTSEYLPVDCDQLILAIELPISVLSLQESWKAAMRAARALVRNYRIKSVVIKYLPGRSGILFDRIRVFERYNPNAVCLRKIGGQT